MPEESTTKETVLVAWKANEYPEYTRTPLYYGVVGLLFLGIIGYSIYSGDWYGAAIIIILIGFMLWYQRQTPSVKTYRLSQLGLYIDRKFYPYNEMYSYWFFLDQQHKSLNIIFQKKYLPQLTILLGDLDPLKIRTTLGKYIPEEGNRTENIADTLMRWFRL